MSSYTSSYAEQVPREHSIHSSSTHNQHHTISQHPHIQASSTPSLPYHQTQTIPFCYNTAHSLDLSRKPRVDSCMNFDPSTFDASWFAPQLQETWSHTSPHEHFGVSNTPLDILAQPVHPSPAEWSMYSALGNNSGMGAPGPASLQGHKRSHSHQRTPSASTVTSNGPASPYPFNTANPHIVNTEFAPGFDYSTAFSKDLLPTPSHTPTGPAFLSANYVPGQVAHSSAAHLAMKGFSIDHHNFEDFPSDFPHSARQSMSSVGQDSPATPRSAVDDPDTRHLNKPAFTAAPSNTDYRTSNPVTLQRTESAAYQDELYNPANFSTAPPSSGRAINQYLYPSSHRNLVNERLRSAEIARSVSPSSAVSRERSPFREGSQLAPAPPPVDGWASPNPPIGTAASRRQQMKEEREQAEYAHHTRRGLQREATKTISPKDALLEYNEPDQPSLFQDNVPTGYKQHFGGTETYPTGFFSQSVTGYDQPTNTQQASFRATPVDALGGANFNFSPPNMQPSGQVQSNPFQLASYQQGQNMNAAYSTATVPETSPQFPATLTSMESSFSDQGPPQSSQESVSTGTLQRPADTRAHTGTYTCTYHGCAQRFDSHANLQKHKRESHRPQQLQVESPSSAVASDSASQRSTQSPVPSTAGMTSAQILARNSQAGPHKCTRINPSTGKPCNTIFSRPYDLTRHEDTIHNNRKQKVRCPYCREEKNFSRNDALTRHMRVVHPDVENFGKRSRRGD